MKTLTTARLGGSIAWTSPFVENRDVQVWFEAHGYAMIAWRIEWSSGGFETIEADDFAAASKRAVNTGDVPRASAALRGGDER